MRLCRSFVCCLLVAVCWPALATTFPVNNPADAVDASPGDGTCATALAVCTLRAAVQEANALAGADVITLPAGTYTLTIAGQFEDAAATGDLDVTGDLTINGAGAATTVIDGDDLDRVFEMRSGTYTLTLNDLTITDGALPGATGGGVGMIDPATPASLTATNVRFISNSSRSGAGIGFSTDAGGDITLTNVTFDGNTATDDGGAIFHNTEGGNLVITDSSFGVTTANTATDLGGAIMFIGGANPPAPRPRFDVTRTTIMNNVAGDAAGGIFYCCFSFDATLVDSTIANNTAGGISPGLDSGAGGLYTCCNASETITIENTTISGNVALSGDGGGIEGQGDTLLMNVTVANNTAPVGMGGGINLNDGVIRTQNTIYANNTGGNCGGGPPFMTSQGGNISSDATCTTSLTLASDDNSTNPLLGPLANNGGPTLTHALLPGSPAIDAGVATGAPATDQRGVARPQGPAFDSGAYEAAAAALTPTTTTLISAPNPSDSGENVTFTATVAGAGGPPTGTVTFFDGATPLGTVALTGGTATFNTAALTPGTHSITARYNGNATFAQSTSAPLSQVVVGAAAAADVPLLDPRALFILATVLAAVAVMAVRR